MLHTSRMSGLTPNQWEKARKAIEILSKIPVCVAGESSRVVSRSQTPPFFYIVRGRVSLIRYKIFNGNGHTIEFLDLSCWNSS